MTGNSFTAKDGKTLTILVPGLFSTMNQVDDSALNGDSLQAPVLETLLTRSDASTLSTAQDYATSLFCLFACDVPQGADIPTAALSYLADQGEPPPSWCLRADPVYLVPQGDQLILHDATVLDLSQEEADQLVRHLLELFADDGWVLQAAHRQRWYLSLAKAPSLGTTPLERVVGHNIYPFLPTGEDGQQWHRILTEVQAHLHQAPVNIEREANGRLPVNSLWFWGGGELPAVAPGQWERVWGEDPMLKGLTQAGSITAAVTLPTHCRWLQEFHASPAGRYLLVLPNLIAAQRYHAGLQALDRHWLRPLRDALQSGELSQLILLDEQGRRFVLSSRQLRRRWWRWRRSLRHLANHHPYNKSQQETEAAK